MPLKIDPQHGSEFRKKEIYFSLFRIKMSSAGGSLHISGVWRLFVSLEIPNMIRLPLLEIASRARVFQARCQPHCKRKSARRVSGCKTLRSLLHWRRHSVRKCCNMRYENGVRVIARRLGIKVVSRRLGRLDKITIYRIESFENHIDSFPIGTSNLFAAVASRTLLNFRYYRNRDLRRFLDISRNPNRAGNFSRSQFFFQHLNIQLES